MSDLEREELDFDEGVDDAGFGVKVEETESGTLEQRTRIDGHHHHHHSHKHHSKAYYKYRKARHKIKKQLHSKNTRLIYIAVILLLCIALVATSIYSQRVSKKYTATDNSETTLAVDIAETGSVVVESSVFNSEQLLVNNVLEGYMAAENDVSLADKLASVSTEERLDVSKPVCLEYKVSKLPARISIVNVRILVSEDSELKNGISYDKDSAESSVEVPYLKTGTKYFYSIDVILSNETTVSTVGSFVTAATPRIISVEGIANVRDIGGWKTRGGKTVKQGRLYRGTELDGVYVEACRATDTGVITLTRNLGVVCDFDLRGNDSVIPSQSPLGASVKHLQFAVEPYSNVFVDEYEGEIRSAFSSLADRNNYPMYMHCTYGLDRTGTVCYILEALLGMSEEDLLKEYELSCLYYRELRPSDRGTDFMNFVADFNELNGANSQEKAQNYLLSIGVTQDEINSIKDIFLG